MQRGRGMCHGAAAGAPCVHAARDGVHALCCAPTGTRGRCQQRGPLVPSARALPTTARHGGLGTCPSAGVGAGRSVSLITLATTTAHAGSPRPTLSVLSACMPRPAGRLINFPISIHASMHHHGRASGRAPGYKTAPPPAVTADDRSLLAIGSSPAYTIRTRTQDRRIRSADYY